MTTDRLEEVSIDEVVVNIVAELFMLVLPPPPSRADEDSEEVRVKPGTGRRRLAERGMSKMAPLPRFCTEFSGGMVM
jgi:hypothetical protein